MGVLERREAAQQATAFAVHGRDLERARIEECEGKVDVREAIEVQVLGQDWLALASCGPGLVIPYSSLGNRVATARWPFDVAAASEPALTSGAAEVAR